MIAATPQKIFTHVISTVYQSIFYDIQIIKNSQTQRNKWLNPNASKSKILLILSHASFDHSLHNHYGIPTFRCPHRRHQQKAPRLGRFFGPGSHGEAHAPAADEHLSDSRNLLSRSAQAFTSMRDVLPSLQHNPHAWRMGTRVPSLSVPTMCQPSPSCSSSTYISLIVSLGTIGLGTIGRTAWGRSVCGSSSTYISLIVSVGPVCAS